MVNGRTTRRNVGLGTRKNIGLASARGANRAVRQSKVSRDEKILRKISDPRSRLSKSQTSIRKGTVNIKRVFDPSSSAESF